MKKLEEIDMSKVHHISCDMDNEICQRVTGEFTHKGFYLDDDYSWDIVEDNEGQLTLIKMDKHL